MIKFDFGTGYIRQFDERNWCVASARTIKKGKNAGETSENIWGYYPTIKAAKIGAIEKFGKSAESLKDLNALIDRIEKIKNN